MSGQQDQHRTTDENTTQDLGARYAATSPVGPPSRRPWYETAGAEEHIRTRGRFLIISGIAVGVLTFMLATVWRQGFDENMPAAYLLPLYAVAFGAVAIGGMEYLSRPTRYTNELCVHHVNELERQISALVGLLSEELKQQYYQGIADQAKTQAAMTGTENSRRFERDRSGEILRFRRR